MTLMMASTGGVIAGSAQAGESLPWEPGGAVTVTYWDHLTFDPGVALDGVGTPGSIITVVDHHGRLNEHPVQVADDGTWSMDVSVLPVNAASLPSPEDDLTRLTITQRTNDVVDGVVELHVGESPASGFDASMFELPATGPHLAGAGTPGDVVIVRTCAQDFSGSLGDCGEPRSFTVADDGTWYVVVPEPEAMYVLFDVFRDGTRVDGRNVFLFGEPWEWNETDTDPVLDGTTVDLRDGTPAETLAPVPSPSTVVAPGGWVNDPIFAAPLPGGEVAIRNAGPSLDDSHDLLFGVGTPGATIHVATDESDPDAFKTTVADDGTWSAEHQRGTGPVGVTQTVDGTVGQSIDVDTAAPLEGFAITQVEGSGNADYLAGEGTPGDTVIVRQCDEYPTCWLVGEFTIPDDGTWTFQILNRADGPTLMDAYRDRTWLGGQATWVTEDTINYPSSPIELKGTSARLGPITIPAPQELEPGGTEPQPTATPTPHENTETSRGHANTTNPNPSRSPLPWALGVTGVLGVTGAILLVVHHRTNAKHD